MVLNHKILSGVALGLSLAVTACGTGQPDTQQPVNQDNDTLIQTPGIGKEDTVDTFAPYDPGNCPACGMG